MDLVRGEFGSRRVWFAVRVVWTQNPKIYIYKFLIVRYQERNKKFKITRTPTTPQVVIADESATRRTEGYTTRAGPAFFLTSSQDSCTATLGQNENDGVPPRCSDDISIPFRPGLGTPAALLGGHILPYATLIKRLK